MDKIIWKPSQERINQSNIIKYMDFLTNNYDVKVRDYESLYEWSIQQCEDFWRSVWEYCEIIGDLGNGTILENNHKMPGAYWFTDSKLNYAENLLNKRDSTIAIIEIGENSSVKTITYQELIDTVCQLQSSMKRIGIGIGDRVVGYLPNINETVICMLATASLGAIWSSCSPDFGIDGVIDRFGQIKPKLLFATNGYQYNGKSIIITDRVQNISNQLQSLIDVVIIPYLEEELNWSDKDFILFKDFLDNKSDDISFERLPFSHPLYIMFSSGTTGIPKCMVHSAGGTLIQHLKELILHTDIKEEDIIFYYTTCGWMMWNWLISSLSVGATIVLYDGSPFFPDKNSLFELIDKTGITIFGGSAKFFSTCEKNDLVPMKTNKLTTLNTILSTGSPLSPESFEYIYSKVKKDICVSSISGGTDIISCFALGCPILPVYKGELQCPGLGMDIAIFNDKEREVFSEKGELVCKSPFPSMPTGFWNDPDGSKYHKAYFELYDNIWAHRDYAEIILHKDDNNIITQRGVIIYGRSDSTLNPSGVRIGTAEIYREVEKIEEVLESVVIGQNWDGDTRIVLFIKLKESFILTSSLHSKIITMIRDNTSHKHIPAKIISVQDIPKTISGKISESAVRNIVHDIPVKNIDALANPQSLEYFKNIDELKR